MLHRELSFTTKNVLAQMHTGVEGETFILRMLMTFVTVFVPNQKWQSVALLVLGLRLTYVVWKW